MIWIAPLAMLAMLAFMAIGGLVVELLWNWLLPPLFGWHAIGFWQAVGILVLCRILFGGRSLHGAGRRGFRRRLRDRCAGMTPEERAHFRRRMRERMGLEEPTA
jgi:hypothetical protein